MLAFTRSKIVGVERPRENVLLAHGVLDDYIYGMEIDVEVKLPDFEIIGIQGKMKRFTTTECEKAIPKLQNALGLRIPEEDFVRKVNRVVGREGCTHFANLLVECCDAIMQTAVYADWQEGKEKRAAADKETYLRQKLQNIPSLRSSCMVYSQKTQ